MSELLTQQFIIQSPFYLGLVVSFFMVVLKKQKSKHSKNLCLIGLTFFAAQAFIGIGWTLYNDSLNSGDGLFTVSFLVINGFRVDSDTVVGVIANLFFAAGIFSITLAASDSSDHADTPAENMDQCI